MKKNILLVATLVVIMASFMACKNEEPVASEPASSSEVASEEVSSEEVSEEASSEEVASDYSADAIMKLVDGLVVKYPYNNPEHIKALVIAANLDHISAEDLDTILNTYGYTMDDLALLYDECVLDSADALQNSFAWSQGQIDKLTPEQTYEKRITMGDALINEEDAKFAQKYDNMLINRSNGISDRNEAAQFRQLVVGSTKEFQGIENFVYSYTSGTLYINEVYTDYFNNPYVDYQKAN